MGVEIHSTEVPDWSPCTPRPLRCNYTQEMLEDVTAAFAPTPREERGETERTPSMKLIVTLTYKGRVIAEVTHDNPMDLVSDLARRSLTSDLYQKVPGNLREEAEENLLSEPSASVALVVRMAARNPKVEAGDMALASRLVESTIRCKNCRFWSKDGGLKVGDCDRIDMSEDTGCEFSPAMLNAGASDDDGLHASLRTSADFGCVCGEPKDRS